MKRGLVFLLCVVFVLYSCTIRSPEAKPFEGDVGIRDTEPPRITIGNPHDGEEVGEIVVFGGTVVDDVSGVRRVMVSLDGKEWGEADLRGCFWSTNLILTKYSNYTFWVYAEDWKEKVSSTQKIMVRRVPFPVIVLESPFPGWYTNVSSVLLRGKAWIDQGYHLVSLRMWHNGEEVCLSQEGSNWQSVVELQEGSNTFVVEAISDNHKTNTLLFYGMKDTTLPQIFLITPSHLYTGKRFLLSGTVVDESGIRQVYVKKGNENWKGGSLEGGEWWEEVMLPSYGFFTNLIYAVDIAGNSSFTNTNIVCFQPSVWTIGIYMNADNDLDEFSLPTLKDLESIAALTNGKVQVVVLVDRSFRGVGGQESWTGTRLYHIQYDPEQRPLLVSARLKGMGLDWRGDRDELNLGSKEVFTNFVAYVKENFPSTNLAIVLWGHWSGWKVKEGLWDEFSADGLDVMELGSITPYPMWTFFGIDGCTAGMLEVAYELRHLAQFFVCSPDVTPRAGWPYKTWLSAFMETGLSKDDFSTTLLSSYEGAYASVPKAALAVYAISNIYGVMHAWTNYVRSLYNEVINPAHIMRTTQHGEVILRDVESYFRYTDGYYHIDVWSLAENMSRSETVALTNALSAFVAKEWHSMVGDKGTGNPYSHGLGVYFGTPFLDGNTWCLFMDDCYAYSNTTLSSFQAISSLWRKYLRVLHYDFACDWIYPDTWYGGSLISNKDTKWYKIYAEASGILDVELCFGPQDYDLALYNEKLELIESSSNPSTNQITNREFLKELFVDEGWVFVRVKSYAGNGPFSLKIKTYPVYSGGAVIK